MEGSAMQRKRGHDDFAPRYAGLVRRIEPIRQYALRTCGVTGQTQVERITDEVRFVWTPGSNDANSAILIDRDSASAALTDPGTSGLLDVSREKDLYVAEVIRRAHVELRYVCLTHGHADHIGDGKLCSSIDVIYAHHASFGHLLDPGSWVEDMIQLARLGRGDFKNNPVLKALCQNRQTARLAWRLCRTVVYGRGLEPFGHKENGGLLVAYPRDGQLRLGELDITVLETPGHSPDEVTLVVNTDGKKVLIVGDIIRPQRGLPIDAVPSGFAPEVDPYAIERSLLLLLGQNADVLLPAHGRPIIGQEEVRRVLMASLAMTCAIVKRLEHFWTTQPNWTAQRVGNAVFRCLGLCDKLLNLDERTSWAGAVYRKGKEGTLVNIIDR